MILILIHFCYHLDQADKNNRHTWLFSSSVTNVPFYQSHGFESVSTFTVGEKNPQWDKDPIVVTMVRSSPRHTSRIETYGDGFRR